LSRGRRRGAATAIRLLAASLALVLGVGTAAAGVGTVEHEFHSEDRAHRFRGSFYVDAERSCVVGVLFSPHHLARFAGRASEVELVAEGEAWNEVRYEYRNWLMTHRETYRRILTGGTPAIRFELLGVEHEGLHVPLPITSHGHYGVRDTPEGVRVEYVQEAVLGPGPLLWVHQQIARREAIRFLRDLADYLREACPPRPEPGGANARH
jgi:hypothetical protein